MPGGAGQLCAGTGAPVLATAGGCWAALLSSQWRCAVSSRGCRGAGGNGVEDDQKINDGMMFL